jgi:hypothetical protein
VITTNLSEYHPSRYNCGDSMSSLDWIYAPSKGVYLQNTQGVKFTILVLRKMAHISCSETTEKKTQKARIFS